ncbi:MAG: hypothetical protein E7262_07100 [Lachnospiraceae bacterium]|nr:hypothetical protein [Lachnospiraceae bacterium]
MKKKDNLDKKQKHIKMSIFVKILAPILITVIVLSVVLTMVSYNIQKENLINNACESAKVIAKSAKVMLDDYDYMSIKHEKDMNTVRFFDTFEVLRKIVSNSNVDYLYTVYFEDENIYYGIDADDNPETRCLPGKEYEVDKVTNIEYKTLIKNEVYVDTYIHYYQGVPYLTAIIPVKSEAGDVVGGIGCDYNATLITKKLNETLKLLILIAIMFVVISSVVIILITRVIVKNITVINNKMITLIDNNGDLTQKLNIKSGDEIERVSNNTNNFISSIRKVIVGIRKSIGNIDDLSDKSSDMMKKAHNGIEGINEKLKDMNGSMTNVIDKCSTITEASDSVKYSVEDMNTYIKNGVETTVRMNNYAKDISEQNSNSYNYTKGKAEELALKLNEKLEHAKEIYMIASLAKNILDITDQTNLLALNASIESVRAGDVGKGFIVVAEQINKLATLTGDVANHIQQVSDSIITSVEDLTIGAQNLLGYLDETLLGGFNELVDNSNMYQKNSVQLKEIFLEFSDFTKALTRSVESMQQTILEVTDDVGINAKSIEDISHISEELNTKIMQLHGEVNEITQASKRLSNEADKFKV